MTKKTDRPFINKRTAELIDRLTELQLSYVAGLFDGEGSIGIYEIGIPRAGFGVRPAFHFQVQIANTYWPIIQWLTDTVGGRCGKKSFGKDHWQQGYVWRLTGANAEYFMRVLEPYCIIKKPQIAIALSFRSKFNQPRGIMQPTDMIQEKRAMILELKAAKRA
jgi:hypothetical protein